MADLAGWIVEQMDVLEEVRTLAVNVPLIIYADAFKMPSFE